MLEYEFVSGLVPQYFLDANGEVVISILELYSSVTDNCSVTVSAGGLTGGEGNEWTVNVEGSGFGDEVTWELRDSLGAVILSGGPYGLGYNDTQTVTTMNEPLVFYIETLGFWNDNTPSYTLSCSDEVVATAQMAGGAETTLSGLECHGDNGGSTGLVFTCEDIGVVNIVVIATDASGNVSSCLTQVEIVDATSPVASCMDFTLELGADGTVTLLPKDIGGNSTVWI